MKTKLFDYELPEELIAQCPSKKRDSSRMMLIERKTKRITHHHFSDILEFLKEGDCLVINTSRVRKARMRAHKAETQAAVELLFLERAEGNTWSVMARPAKRLRAGDQIELQGGTICRVLEKGEAGQFLIERINGKEDLETLMEKHGEIPLPPYIRDYEGDLERYQNVYSSETGSAACPTAGLHFTKSLISEIQERGVSFAECVLDVGQDTFRPIDKEEIEDHDIHTEKVEVSEHACRQIMKTIERGCKIVAVGTTSVRAIETAAVAYKRMEPYGGRTDLYIKPGYGFKIADAIITNFHFPKTTLMVMVSAFTGRELLLKAYGIAVREQYRFYSFGDSMLIL